MRKQKKKGGVHEYVVEGAEMRLLRRKVYASSPTMARKSVKESMYRAHDGDSKALDKMVNGDFWGYKVIRVQEI